MEDRPVGALQIQKIWQHETHSFVLAVSPIGTGWPAKISKKLYLTLRCSSRPTAMLNDSKPAPLTPDHPVAQIMRKYVVPGRILGWLDLNGSLCLTISTIVDDRVEYFFLDLRAGQESQRTWELDFGTTQMSFCRMNASGTFTKRKERGPDEARSAGTLRPCFDWLEPERNDEDAQEPPTDQIGAGSQAPLSEEQRHLRDKISRRCKTLRKSEQRLVLELPSPEDIAKQEALARRLRQFSYLYKAGSDRLVIPAAASGEADDETLFVDPELSISAQIEQAWNKSKKLTTAIAKISKQLSLVRADLKSAQEQLDGLRAGQVSHGDLLRVAEATGFGTTSQSRSGEARLAATQTEATPWRVFHLEGGWMVWVGKSAAGNDELYRKAKSNDHFFHVVSPQGSHVIVRTRDKSELPPTVARQAAILALHFSKIRRDQGGEVYQTKRANIMRRKGMPSGLVLVQRSSVLHVKYEQEELDQVLKTEERGG